MSTARARWDASHALRRASGTLETGLFFWTAGVALAFYAQDVLQHDVGRGRLLLLAAAVIATVGMRRIDEVAPSQSAPILDRAEILSRPRAASGVLFVLGVIVSLIGVRLVTSDAGLAGIASCWVVSTALVVLAAALHPRDRMKLTLPRLGRSRAIEVALLLAIVALAVALRLPRLSAIPPDVHGDEASVGLDARALLHGGWNQLFEIGWAGLPELGYGSVAVVMWVFGDDLFGLRMASLLEGVASVALIFLVTRRLFGPRPALMAAFILAVAQWHIHFSRTGFHYMQALPAILLAVYFAVRALDTKRALDFVLLGMSLALCTVVYFAAREIAAILAPYVLYRLVSERQFWRSNVVGLAVALVAFLVFLAPVISTVKHRSQPLLGYRSDEVSLFKPENLAHERDAYQTSSTLRIVGIQARRTLEAVNRTGETSAQWGRAGKPLFDLWLAALLVPGVVYSISRIRQSRHLLLMLWLAVPTLVTIFTIDAPFSPHLIAALPVLAILPALVVDAGWRAVARVAGSAGQAVFCTLVAVLAALVLHANYQSYFEEHTKEVRIAGFPTLVSQYARNVSDRYRVYLVSAQHSLRYEVVLFLAPHLDGTDLGSDPRLPLREPSPGKGAVFIVDSTDGSDRRTVPELERVYPGGIRTVHADVKGVPAFVSYQVGRDELARSLAAAQ